MSWRGEETGKGFVLVLHPTTGNLSAAGLGPGEVVPVPSTALGTLPLKIPQWLEKMPSEQTKERKIPNVAQQPERRITSRTLLSTEITAGIDNLNQKKTHTKTVKKEI